MSKKISNDTTKEIVMRRFLRAKYEFIDAFYDYCSSGACYHTEFKSFSDEVRQTFFTISKIDLMD